MDKNIKKDNKLKFKRIILAAIISFLMLLSLSKFKFEKANLQSLNASELDKDSNNKALKCQQKQGQYLSFSDQISSIIQGEQSLEEVSTCLFIGCSGFYY